MRRVVLGTLLASAMIMTQAEAGVIITFGGTAAGDGSNLTTSLAAPNVFVEDFDDAGACGFDPNVQAAPGAVVGDYALVTGNLSGRYAAPSGDSTCYITVPGPVSNGSGSVDVDLGLVFTSAPNQAIDYLGLYWGSIDTYNSFSFFNGDDLIGTLTGADVLAAGATFGDQIAAGANRYVNLFFTDGDRFTKFVATSTSFAFEFDNVAVRVVSVPEPGILGLFGFGLILGGVAVRRRK